MNEMNVFFSWQSDMGLAAHRNLIRDALREAGSTLEQEGVIVRLAVDEAARGAPGSPDISAEIFRKIASADVFVGDLTLVHRRAAEDPRAFSNPNVTLELGFAVARLGWGRTIAVVNDHCGKPEELPFDVRGRLVARYKCDPSAGAKGAIGSARGALRDQLTENLRLIATAKPKLPVVAAVDPDAVKRQRDLAVIRRLLRFVNPDAIRQLGDSAPEVIPHRAFYFQEGFAALWEEDATTQLHDSAVKALFADLDTHWKTPLSFWKHYLPGNGGLHYVWTQPDTNDEEILDAADADRAKAEAALHELRRAIHALWEHLHKHYLEIDLDEASLESWRLWREKQVETP